MEQLQVAVEYKALGDADGSFEGYASVFGNVDLGGDVVAKGAFKELDLTKDGMVRVLNSHNTRDPIGKAVVREDDHGLFFSGKLILDLPSARNVYSLMKSGIIDKMSIGYDILAGGAEMMESGVRKLTALKLWEISVTAFAMNPQARIETVKTADSIKTIRDYEKFLRDAGFSAARAKQLASVGFKAPETERDANDRADVRRLTELIKSLKIPPSLGDHHG